MLNTYINDEIIQYSAKKSALNVDFNAILTAESATKHFFRVYINKAEEFSVNIDQFRSITIER